jgi:hypothetical protein
MRARLEGALLAAAGLAVGAFALSFALGVNLPGGSAPAGDPIAARRAAAGAPEPPPALARVEVLNRSGRPGLARLGTERLRAAGYDVVFFGNAPASVPDTSVVIDRVGRPELARGAAAALGIARTTTQVDSSLHVDASVILGGEWQRAAGATVADTVATADRPLTRGQRLRRMLPGG